MNKLRNFYFLFIIILLSACSGGYNIKGTVSDNFYNGDTVYVKRQSGDEIVTVGNCRINSGSFGIKGDADTTFLAVLYLGNMPVVPFVVESGEIKIDIDGGNVNVSGTVLNDELDRFMAKKDSFDIALDEVLGSEARMIMDGVPADEARDIVERKFVSLTTELELYVDGYIRRHYNDVIGPCVLKMYCADVPYSLLNERVKKLIEDAPDVFRNDSFVKGMFER